MTTENPDLGKSLYEHFVRGEYDRDWSNLPAGVKARWNEVAAVNRCATVTISADNATITKAIEKLQAEIAIVFQQHRAALAEISRGLALAGNRLQRLSLEFVMGSSQAIEISEWAEEARATIENAPHFREDSHPAPEGHLREALAAIVAIGDAEPRTIHDQQTQRYSQKAIDIARKALAGTPSPETNLMGCETMVNPPNDNEKSIPPAIICADRERDSRHGAGFHAGIDRAAKRDSCNLLPGSERILDISMRADARSAPDVLLGGHDSGPSGLHVPPNPFGDRQAVTALPELKAAGSRSMDEATLPTTSRLSQLEARTSCAASVTGQLTSPSPQPQNRERGE